MGERGLRIKVNAQHAIAIKRGSICQVLRHDGLAHAALEVGHGNADGAAIGAAGQQCFTPEPQAAAQFVDFLKREPALAAIILGFALGQGGVIGQFLAQGIGGMSNMNWLISQIEKGRSALTTPGSNVARRTDACCARLRAFMS